MLMRRVYYGMISLIDAEIGRVLAFLNQRSTADDTLIIFTSDHGDYMGDHGLYTKSPALYDCLVRVPLIVRWPGHVDADRRDRRFASHIDFMPTFAAAAGIPCPAQAQGIDLLPFLQDAGAGGEIRPAAFSEYGIPGTRYDETRLVREGLADTRWTNPGDPRLPWEGNPVTLAGRLRMIRTHEWKYVEDQGDMGELYNLVNDPFELVNLCGQPQYAAVQQDLARRLRSWKASLAGVEDA
jgi:arylsulfatase A-like enzyme